MTAKTNYTVEQTAAIIADYANGVSVEQIALSVGKTTRSIVAKLSREGVYKKAERTTKNGDAIVKKDALADKLMALANLTEAEATSLAKVNKTALVKLITLLTPQHNDVS